MKRFIKAFFRFLLSIWVVFVCATGNPLSAFADTVSQAVQSGNVVNSCFLSGSDTGYCAQRETFPSDFQINDVTVKISNDGGLNTNVIAYLQGEAAGAPDGTDLDSSGSLNTAGWTSGISGCSATAETFSYSSPTTHPAGSYWIVWKSDSYGSTAATRWCGDPGNTYTDHDAFTTTDTSTWNVNSHAAYYIVDYTPQSGGGGSATSTEATSTPDQTQQNYFNLYWSFLATMFFVVWLISPRK